uniref:NADH-ubiquinone oxidoreductase chain 4 n=1 Tax=Otobius megnini TaxID=34606 RepID=W0FIB9_OTOMG|nr:NADH dehydrogenase subunit 4 [Otobius megnini]AHF21634.1 NADH dehydrogenase subunit 4 [Otobius megnini]AIZ58590.1 NADH dehydrogenase subunit 4 [Otobius megnini]UYB78413.1 NADH dehydrogenase subunit 4 [Otobius megnini]
MLVLIFSMLWLVCLYLYYSMVELMMLFMMLCMVFFVSMDWTSLCLYIGESLKVDLLNFMLIELSLWFGMLMLLASMGLKMFFKKSFLVYVIMMINMLIFCFGLVNFMGFYLFFESVLIPIMMMVFGWGVQPERLQAGLYMLFYTLAGSLPLFFFLLSINESLNMVYINWINWSFGSVMMIMAVGGFLVKIPMFMFHLWLPKAHVEAPIAGSMILAGVLLKLGIYGLIRISFFLKEMLKSWGFLMMSISLVGGIFVGLICLCQIDVKSLIAYSSVSHMGLSLSGIMSMSGWGLYGSMIMMIGHGLCSSALFCLANFYYERFFTRSMILLKGLGILFPFLGFWWFMFLVINMAAPPFMNLGAELLLLGGIMKWCLLALIPLSVSLFLSAAYSLFLYSYLNHGSSWVVFAVKMISLRELILMMFHFIPLLLWVLKMEFFLMWF